MAAGATIHTFTVQLADVDRGVYESFSLRAAKHPSETEACMALILRLRDRGMTVLKQRVVELRPTVRPTAGSIR